MGWLPVAKPQRSRLVALGVARRKVVPKFDEGLKSARTRVQDGRVEPPDRVAKATFPPDFPTSYLIGSGQRGNAVPVREACGPFAGRAEDLESRFNS